MKCQICGREYDRSEDGRANPWAALASCPDCHQSPVFNVEPLPPTESPLSPTEREAALRQGTAGCPLFRGAQFDPDWGTLNVLSGWSVRLVRVDDQWRALVHSVGHAKTWQSDSCDPAQAVWFACHNACTWYAQILGGAVTHAQQELVKKQAAWDAMLAYMNSKGCIDDVG